MHPRPLPAELDTAFHVRDADRLGIPPRRLRARDLRSPFHGVRYAGEDPGLGSVAERCHAYLPRMSGGQFFSHVTAASLWGMPLPFPHGEELHVSAVPPAREPRTSSVTGHRLVMPPDGITLLDDLPVAARTETWAQLGAVLRVDDLVAVGDWLVAQGDPVPDLEEVALRARRRGAVALREAAGLVRPGAESPRESTVRLVLVDAGLPEPQLNWTLRTASGLFVARLDMAYPEQRVAVEYDGRHHAEAAQFRRDADRWRAISDAGWTLVRVLAHHLDAPNQLIVAPVRSALLAARPR